MECEWDLSEEHELSTFVGAQKIVHETFAHKEQLLITSQWARRRGYASLRKYLTLQFQYAEDKENAELFFLIFMYLW